MEINKKAAEDLDSALLKDALVQSSLCLTVRTYPEIEEGQKLMQPPPRRLENPSDLSDNTLAFAGSNQGTGLEDSNLQCASVVPLILHVTFTVEVWIMVWMHWADNNVGAREVVRYNLR